MTCTRTEMCQEPGCVICSEEYLALEEIYQVEYEEFCKESIPLEEYSFFSLTEPYHDNLEIPF